MIWQSPSLFMVAISSIKEGNCCNNNGRVLNIWWVFAITSACKTHSWRWATRLLEFWHTWTKRWEWTPWQFILSIYVHEALHHASIVSASKWYPSSQAWERKPVNVSSQWQQPNATCHNYEDFHTSHQALILALQQITLMRMHSLKKTKHVLSQF